eukprot:GHVU01102968.1.p1 GENE.GHVU01102968.1~~GHVU01102968.1.p1  ORF type:complete len:118 (-),score=3.95 GHVU01102968.1:1164-1517(-)
MHVLLQNLLSFPQSQMWARTTDAEGLTYFKLLNYKEVLKPNSKRFHNIPVDKRTVLFQSQNESTKQWVIFEVKLGLLDSENLIKATRFPIGRWASCFFVFTFTGDGASCMNCPFINM